MLCGAGLVDLPDSSTVGHPPGGIKHMLEKVWTRVGPPCYHWYMSQIEQTFDALPIGRKRPTEANGREWPGRPWQAREGEVT